MEVLRVKILNSGVVGFEVSLPNSPPMVLLVGRRAFIMCGYLNIELAEKFNAPCIRVTGVRTVEDVLEKEVVEITAKARELGITAGVKVREILDKL